MSQLGVAKTCPALVSYPKQAEFGRTLPKNKIYEHSGANTWLKDLFVEQVEQIVWRYKLAPETTNLPAKPGVPEIQVFTILLKTTELHHDVLRCIDGAVQFPIIFELTYGSDRRQHGDGVAVLEGGLQGAQKADVLVVDVDVHEAVQLALVGDEAALDAGVTAVEIVDEALEGVALGFDGLLPAGVRTEDGRNADLDGHAGALLCV